MPKSKDTGHSPSQGVKKHSSPSCSEGRASGMIIHSKSGKFVVPVKHRASVNLSGSAYVTVIANVYKEIISQEERDVAKTVDSLKKHLVR